VRAASCSRAITKHRCFSQGLELGLCLHEPVLGKTNRSAEKQRLDPIDARGSPSILFFVWRPKARQTAKNPGILTALTAIIWHGSGLGLRA
jgi:hypothetical protein